MKPATYDIDPLHDPRWADFLSRTPAASIFHSPVWLSALHATYGYRPTVLTTAAPAQPLTDGLLFCEVRSRLTGRRFVSLPFSDHCEPLGADLQSIRVLIDALKARSEADGCRYAEMRPTTCLARFTNGFTTTRTFVLHRLDLRPGAPSLFRHLHASCIQRKIRRAQREDLRVEAGTSAGIIDAFYRLVVGTRRRQRLPPQPIAWFRNLAKFGGEDVRIYLAWKDAHPAAGILTLRFKNTVTYKYGASDDRFRTTGAMTHVLWRAIQDAVDSGLEELDLGRSDLDDDGLATFKDHWAATRSTLCYWRYSPGHTRANGHVWRSKVADTLWACVPNQVFTAAGRLLYKHVG